MKATSNRNGRTIGRATLLPSRAPGCALSGPCGSAGASPSRKATRRRGFTLIEVVLALALMVILLSAVYGAIHLYGQLTTAGRTDMDRARLARAILRQIERDLHSVVFRESEELTIQPTANQNQSDPSGIGTDDTTAAPEPTTAYTAPGGGVFGDASSLIVHVSRPSRGLTYSLLGDGTGGRTSDLLSVSWFLASANTSGLQGAVGNLAAGGSALSSQAVGIQGLARLEGDRLAVTMADQQGQTADLAASAELLAEEVNYLQFSYFDGVSWLTGWDSEAMGALPLAIEIVIGFGPPAGEQSTTSPALQRAGIEDVHETYRLVVALPLAAPYVPPLDY